jgi:sulfite reductase beta subunit-like hemoprotein
VTSCPGASSCAMSVTQSRGLARLLTDTLEARPDLVALAKELTIKISGCPNSCGQHHVAGLGFQGGMRKVGGRAVAQTSCTSAAASAPTARASAASSPRSRCGGCRARSSS